LGEGSGDTEAEALLELHKRAGLGGMVRLSKNGKGIDFSPQAHRRADRSLLVDVAQCSFQRLA